MKRLLALALLLVCLVVPLGAYVRLSDAGLGCPDWPGCYGQLSPHHAASHILAAHAANPEGAVSLAKAWKEMLHRYLATTLGVVLLGLNVLAWRQRQGRRVAAGLLLLVVWQGALGRWTVTLLLQPVIVSAHLLGGMSLAALLAGVLWRSRERFAPVMVPARWRMLVSCLPLVLLCQIALGGWVSSNGAALACPAFPACDAGGAWPVLHPDAFWLWRGPDGTAAGAPLLFVHLVSMHWMHRLGALLVGGLVLLVVWRLWPQTRLRPLLSLLAAGYLMQVALGAANVLLRLPLPLAVAHNATAMLLLMGATVLALSLYQRRSVS